MWRQLFLSKGHLDIGPIGRWFTGWCTIQMVWWEGHLLEFLDIPTFYHLRQFSLCADQSDRCFFTSLRKAIWYSVNLRSLSFSCNGSPFKSNKFCILYIICVCNYLAGYLFYLECSLCFVCFIAFSTTFYTTFSWHLLKTKWRMNWKKL
jgi:hypothetical protein